MNATLEPRGSQVEERAREHAGDHREIEACRELWRAVLAYTVSDLHYQKRFPMGPGLTKHQLEMVRRIEESSPSDFVEGDWFREICGYLEVDPEMVREKLEERLELAA